MDQFLASLPKPVLALGAIILGFALLVMFNPPATVCDSQMENFREAEQSFLYPMKTKGPDHPALVGEMFENCRVGNDPGGCFKLFKSLKKFFGGYA